MSNFSLDTLCGDPAPDDLVVVANIAGANGVRGRLKIYPHSKEQTVLMSVKRWWIQKFDLHGVPLSPPKPISVSGKSLRDTYIIAAFDGLDNREDAQALKGYSILISRSDYPSLSKDEFYWLDLIGCLVYSTQTEPPVLIGKVHKLSESGAHDLLHVIPVDAPSDSQQKIKNIEVLIPFVKEIVPDIDVKNKRIMADWAVD